MPEHVAAVFVPVEFIYWKQLVWRFVRSILMSLGMTNFTIPFWGMSYVVRKEYLYSTDDAKTMSDDFVMAIPVLFRVPDVGVIPEIVPVATKYYVPV